MKDNTELEVFVHELIDLCRKHGIYLIGQCYSESIYGQIEIVDAADKDLKAVLAQVDSVNKVERLTYPRNPAVTDVPYLNAVG